MVKQNERNLLSANSFFQLVHIMEPRGNGSGSFGYCEKKWSPEAGRYKGCCRFVSENENSFFTERADWSAPSVSPDGTLAACICTGKTGNALHIYHMQKQKQIGSAACEQIEEYCFSHDSRRFAIISCKEEAGIESGILCIDMTGRKTNANRGFTGEKTYTLSVFDVETGDIRALHRERKRMRKPLWMGSEDAIIFYSSQENAYKKIQAATGEITTLCTGLTLTGKWTEAVLCDEERLLLVPTAYFENGSGQCTHLTCVKTDGSGVIGSENKGQAPQELVPLYGDGDMLENKNSYIVNQNGENEVFAVGARMGKSGIYHADLEITPEKITFYWRCIYEGGVFTALTALDRERLLVVWSQEATAPELYELSVDRGLLSPVTQSNLWMENYQIAKGREFPCSVNGTDGFVHLVMPPSETTDKKLPAVLTVHGGPACFYGGGFSMERQLLAAAGIAVIYGNPRGSSGYGTDYAKSGDAFGAAAEEDAISFVEAAVKAEPLIDAARIGVMGGSYGGYLTAKLAANTNCFKAACMLRGLFHHSLLFANAESAGQSVPAMQADSVFQEMLECSALYCADDIAIPTLICHGERDMCCPQEGAYQLHAAIRDCHPELPVRLRIFDGCAHSIDPDSAENTKNYYEEIINWLKTYL